MSPFSFKGTAGVIIHFNSFFDENHVSKQNSPRWDAAFCGVTPEGLFCLPMSHNKDARLIWVNHLQFWFRGQDFGSDCTSSWSLFTLNCFEIVAVSFVGHFDGIQDTGFSEY